MRESRLLVFVITFSLFALNAKAQPGEQGYSYHIYFTLPPEMEGRFEYGLPIDPHKLNLYCEFYFNGKRPGIKISRIILEEPTHAGPPQIRVSYEFNDGLYDFSALDSTIVYFESYKKQYTATLLPGENCIRDFTGEFQRQRSGRGKCKTNTRYPIDRPDTKTLTAIIEQLKNSKKSKQTKHPSSAQILRIVNSDNEPLFPLVIANGDICEIVEGYGVNAIVLPFPWEDQKISLKIFHPDYPSIKLDSVSRYGRPYDYVYLLREDEDYFLNGGKRHPLEKGYKEIAFWFDHTITDQTLDSIVNVLTLKYQLQLTKDWRKIIQQEIDSLGPDFVESMYGNLFKHLNRVIHFKRKRDYEFNHSYRIAAESAEVRVQIPVSYYQYLIPSLTIYFKDGMSETELVNFEKEYLPNFKRIDFDTYRPEINLISRTYQFIDWIYVPNYLQEVIMKDPRVRYCGETIEEYTLTE